MWLPYYKVQKWNVSISIKNFIGQCCGGALKWKLVPSQIINTLSWFLTAQGMIKAYKVLHDMIPACGSPCCTILGVASTLSTAGTWATPNLLSHTQRAYLPASLVSLTRLQMFSASFLSATVTTLPLASEIFA